MSDGFVECVLSPDLDAVLPLSDTRSIIVVATDNDQARGTIRRCAAMIERTQLRSLVHRVTADSIEFRIPRPDGVHRVEIVALPTRAAAQRGRSASLVIWDEQAHSLRDTGGPSDEKRIAEALGATLTVFGVKGKQVWISTPAGESGALYQNFRMAESGSLASVGRCTPHLEDAAGPAAGVFRSAAHPARRGWLRAGVRRRVRCLGRVSFSGICAASSLLMVRWRRRRRRGGSRAWIRPSRRTSSGWRWSAGASHQKGVLVVGPVAGIEPKGKLLSFDQQRARQDRTLDRVAELLEPYQPRIVTDQHQGDAIKSHFGRLGMSTKVVNLTGPKQTACFVSTRTRIQDRSLRLWSHGGLLEEIRRVRAKDSESILLPRFQGSHCDIISALCLAVWELRGVSDAQRSGRVGFPEGVELVPAADGVSLTTSAVPRVGRRRDPDGHGRTSAYPPAGWGGRPGRSSAPNSSDRRGESRTGIRHG